MKVERGGIKVFSIKPNHQKGIINHPDVFKKKCNKEMYEKKNADL